MDIRTLEDFRKQLIDRRMWLAQQVQKIGKDLSNQAKAGKDWSEIAQAREAEEVLASIDGEERHELDAIDSALERIESGSFGTCGGCGSQISPARLEALPWAALCIDCQEGLEASGGSP